MGKPEISVVVCTYRRPENLRRVLASIAGQRGVTGRYEVVVADDGSEDETPQVVEQFRRSVDFSVRFVTHKHQGFCPGRCRNEGVAAAEGEYLLLLDGDCLIPPDHLQIQLAKREPGVVRLGDHVRLEEQESALITEPMAAAGAYPALKSLLNSSRMWRKAWKATWYKLIRHRTKPRLTSNNVGLWRDDFERVNGFDENYIGWGCEDDDFGLRLRRSGLRLETILWWTWAYHLWHPTVSSMPVRWKEGPNVEYFRRGFHLVRCGNGLVKRTPRDLALQIVGAAPRRELLQQVLPSWVHHALDPTTDSPEVEVLFAPNSQGFSGRAQCNVLIVADPETEFAPQHAAAHFVLTSRPWPQVQPAHQFGLHEFENALNLLLHNSTNIGLSRSAQARALRFPQVAQSALRPAG